MKKLLTRGVLLCAALVFGLAGCGGKKKTAVEPSKEKTLIAAQLRARSALPRSGMRR